MFFKHLCVVLLLLSIALSSYLKNLARFSFKSNYKDIEFRYMLPAYIIKSSALGYDVALGDLFWIKSLQNMDVGQFKKKRFSYLYHLFNTASTLDKKYLPTYLGGGGYLGVIYKDYRGAESLFLKGIEIFPDNIHLLTYLSMLYMTEFKDYEKAAYYMNRASSSSNAPVWYRQLAARLYVKAELPNVALSLLKALYVNEKNEATRTELAKKIKLVQLEKRLLLLNKKKIEYEKTYGKLYKLQALIDKGLLVNLPLDPFGGKFYIAKTGEILVTSTKERYQPFLLQERQEEK